ncbi:syndecan-4 [Trichomycterus rosablanca]|uniref:syndecan-4 n=1 Tax=Trichomycterus rosablanca TaxID=2290929 RepID=UPI002F35C9C3
MLKAYLALVLLAAAAFAESVRETETWMPIKPGRSHDDLVSSGDFGFPDEVSPTPYDEEDDDDDDDDDVDYDKEDYDYFSGSGDEDVLFDKDLKEMAEPEEFDNSIPDIIPSAKPLPTEDSNDIIAVRNNEIAYDPSVSQSHTGEHNIFKKTEVLAAVIAGGAVGLLFAVLLILLLVYRMKKKDEGSYDLGKKPIYKKAPTAEIYA